MAEALTSLRFPAAKPALANVQLCHCRWHTICVFLCMNCGVPLPRREGPRAHALGTSARGGCAMSSPTTPNGTGNRLIDRLPRKEYKSLLPLLETISLAHEV